jgi:undecaprenyl-diphosphatase
MLGVLLAIVAVLAANGDVLAVPMVVLPILGVTSVAVLGIVFWLLTRAFAFRRNGVLLVGSLAFTIAGLAGLAWLRSLQHHTHGALAELDLRAAATATRLAGERHLMDTLNQNSIRTMVLFGGLLVLAAAAVGAFRSAALLALTMSITGVIVEFLKTSPPPPAARLGLPTEHVTSWPSGHAAFQGAIALGIVLWWWAAGLPRPSILAAFLVPLAVMIGYSRAFLGIHWLSEVFAGWLVALTATAIVVAFDRLVVPRLRVPDPARMIPVLVVGVVAVLVTVVTVHSVHRFQDRGPRFGPPGFAFPDFDRSAPPSQPTQLSTVDPSVVLDPLPLYTETLLGTNVQPVNLVVVADRDHVQAAFQRAGWRTAPVSTPKDLLPTWWRGVRSRSEASDPVAPRFYDTRAPDAVLRHAASGGGETVAETEVWELPIQTPDGCSVWALTTAQHDRTVWDWTRVYPARLRAPAVDERRDALARSFAGAGFEDAGRFAFAPDGVGSGPGGSYETDGKVALLRQPGCGPSTG